MLKHVPGLFYLIYVDNKTGGPLRAARLFTFVTTIRFFDFHQSPPESCRISLSL